MKNHRNHRFFVRLAILLGACCTLNVFSDETQAPAATSTTPLEWRLFLDAELKDPGLWSVEGNGDYRLHIVDGRMRVEPDNRDLGAVNVWLKRRLPADFRIEFDYQPLRQIGQNLVFMLAANQLDGRDMLAENNGRNGHYVWITNQESAFNYRTEFLEGKLIEPMSCYTLSFWAVQTDKQTGALRHRVPLQKNPRNFTGALLADHFMPVNAGEGWTPHRFEIEKIGGSLRVRIDGKTTHEVVDAGGQETQAITRQADGAIAKRKVALPVFGEGYFGFRTLHMWPEFSNLRVYVR